MSAICAACIARGKTWRGTDPHCGFTNGQFDGVNNYQCATAAAIRTLVTAEKPKAGICVVDNSDQKYAIIDLKDTDVVPFEDDEGMVQSQPICLWVGWYKHRGRTEGMYLMFDSLPPRPPTEKEALAIVAAYSDGVVNEPL